MKKCGFFLLVLMIFVSVSGSRADEAKEAEGNEEAIFTLQGEKQQLALPTAGRKLYHWPIIIGFPYTSAHFVEYPDGDICESRAFYWGRVIGSDGMQIGIRGFTKNAGDNQMSRPFVISEEERAILTNRLTRFQEIYARYGCADNTLGFYMDKPKPDENLDEFKANAYKYTCERAALAKAAGIPRIMIDMEWGNLKELKDRIGPRETCQYAWEIGREILRAIKDTYAEVEFGFYPGLTGVQYNAENRTHPEGIRFNTRVSLVQGMYDNREAINMFHFSGWSYSATDQCTGAMWWKIKKAPFVHDTYNAMERIMYAHDSLLGPGIRYEWGRWEMGGHRYQKPGVPGLAMIKLANVPLKALERTWKKLYEKSNVVWVWDHFNTWDKDGSNFVTINNDQEMDGFEKWLDEVDPAYHKVYDAEEAEYWIPGSAHTGFKGTKRDMFGIVEKEGVRHITGVLDPQFAKYVNLTKELAGRDRDTIPLYSEEDLKLAREYKKQGYFPYQDIQQAKPNTDAVAYLKPIDKKMSVLGAELAK